MQDTPVTPLATLRRARRIGEESGLRFVYEGNVPGSGGESTRCPGCGALLLDRYGLTLLSNRLVEGACPGCGERIEGVWAEAGGSGGSRARD
jgi:pyruvate formate lyase activating enzyme